MKKKKLNTLIIVVSVLIIFNVLGLIYLYLITNESASGKFVFENKIDTEFNVSVDTPLLVRKVEMVQYCKDDNGNIEMVFSDKPIDSFDGYINPTFPSGITSEVFYDNTTLNGNLLSLDAAKTIAESDIDMIKLEELPEDGGNHLNLVYYNGAYISASNNWKVGEIRVTFYYLDPNKTYSIKGIVNNNVIVSIDSITVN